MQADSLKTSILLIYTGGTIGMIENPVTGALENFSFAQLKKHVPELQKFSFNIDSTQFSQPMDSSDMDAKAWRRLVDIIYRNYEKYTGFVILHGTDTMAFTASALSFMLHGLAKPVILTGSQLPIGVIRTDGKENLLTSLEIAAAQTPEGKPMVPEVCVYFENKLMRGNRTTKLNAEDFNAFRSYNYPDLATVGIHIRYNQNAIHYQEKEQPFEVHTEMNTNVAILKLFPGIQETVVRSVLSISGLKGVVLETYGSGNAPRKGWLIDCLSQASRRGVVIVNVTQCKSGMVDMDRYETGYQLKSAGVLSGYDITTEAALTKLMYLFGQGLTVEEVRLTMLHPLVGEISMP
ncbi:MAG: type I asparaginase [Bacteroidaceae bacterium]|nr:type I asparaginase [Bacteroidaceae bacterium]MBR1541634.1 type I asparaginase [Bacteroidaceae bacterium]